MTGGGGTCAGLAQQRGGHAVPKELSTPDGNNVTSFGAHFEWEDLEGRVHGSIRRYGSLGSHLQPQDFLLSCSLDFPVI